MSSVTNIFDGQKTVRDLSSYTLMRGVTDFANLAQFNLFETGYSFLVVVGIPKFLEKLAQVNDEYKKLINTYIHVLEYEFRGIDGFDNIDADTSELTNGISTLNIITKVNMQSASSFSMRYFEKSGSTMTKVHELFLRGLKDPRTQVKTYHGLIADGTLEAGFENECFSFLYFVTDNSLQNIEKACYIVSAQPKTAEMNIYNSEKGTIEFKEITAEFNGFPLFGPTINAKALAMLKTITTSTVFRESETAYTGVSTLAAYGAVK